MKPAIGIFLIVTGVSILTAKPSSAELLQGINWEHWPQNDLNILTRLPPRERDTLISAIDYLKLKFGSNIGKGDISDITTARVKFFTDIKDLNTKQVLGLCVMSLCKDIRQTLSLVAMQNPKFSDEHLDSTDWNELRSLFKSSNTEAHGLLLADVRLLERVLTLLAEIEFTETEAQQLKVSGEGRALGLGVEPEKPGPAKPAQSDGPDSRPRPSPRPPAGPAAR